MKTYDSVKLYVYELDKLKCNHGPLLYGLKQRGEIDYDHDGNFKVLRDGPIDPRLLDITKKRERVKAPLTDLHRYMRSQLLHVGLDAPARDVPVYFKAFLEHRHEGLDPFFTVDGFSMRVHTPVVNLKHELRGYLRLYGEPLQSLDVRQMQPTILAKVLLEAVGGNPFSDAIFKGEDVYELLQRNASLSTRAEAKKLLFQLIFGKPMGDVGRMFAGDVQWVDWINDYKSKVEPRNPHSKDFHTNLAWLLQHNEVMIMTAIWEKLRRAKIPFLTIHDDVLCRCSDKDRVHSIMDAELQKHFSHYSLNVS